MAMASYEIDDPPPQLKAQAAFLIRRHSDQLRSIALSSDPKLHYSLYVEYTYNLLSYPSSSPFFVFC